MNKSKRFIASIVEIVIGVILALCGYTGIVDEYWGGMGTALIFVGAIMLLRQIRYRTDATYKENVDVQTNDERNRYLRIKAWSYAGYLFVLIAAAISIILKIVGMDQYALAASGCVCLIVVLYWFSYLILNKKY